MNETSTNWLKATVLVAALALSAGCGEFSFILFDDDEDFTYIASRDAGIPVDGGEDIRIASDASVTGADTSPGYAATPRCEPDTSPENNPERIVALGDIHGYLPGLRQVLWTTGLIDKSDHWIGGETVLVQVGDTVDRGAWDKEVIDLLEALKVEARAAGGNVHIIIGNHETDNVMLNFAYVSSDAYAAFGDTPYDAGDEYFDEFPEERHGRVAAFRPGGPYAAILAGHKVVMILSGTLFSHAGLLPQYADFGIFKLNELARDWMLGDIPRPDFIRDISAPFRTREYGSVNDAPVNCEEIRETLDRFCAKRMVVGHTIHDDIRTVCDGLLYQIDVGMYAGERAGAIEILGDEVRKIEMLLE
jgi:hypothetical protein